jgi:hypothetical protein
MISVEGFQEALRVPAERFGLDALVVVTGPWPPPPPPTGLAYPPGGLLFVPSELMAKYVLEDCL